MHADDMAAAPPQVWGHTEGDTSINKHPESYGMREGGKKTVKMTWNANSEDIVNQNDDKREFLLTGDAFYWSQKRKSSI